jgi:flavorubredoxin
MDHSGALPEILKYCPNAAIIASKAGVKGLSRHFKKDWNFEVVKSGDSLSLGKYSLSFVNTPMVHWPDSMVTYLPEEKILFSNDIFGQHIASAERFDDEIGWSRTRHHAAKYYGNIVTPFGKQAAKALAAAGNLDIGMICPSHGLIWRSFIPKIVEAYSNWSAHVSEKKALIIYDSMWNSTENLANALEEGLGKAGVNCTVRNLKVNHISDIMTDVLDSQLILLGSPTLNNGMLPTMGQFLTYLKGLKPQNRIGFAFGSYGWGGQAVKELEGAIETLGWEQPFKGINIEYIPDSDEISSTIELGQKLGSFLLDSK